MAGMGEIVAEVMLAECRLQLVRGDLTLETTEAIVNAANAQLMHGGGVAAAIVRGGGPTIQQESDMWVRERGAVTREQPAWTTGGRLPARYVIHAVGPVWGEGDEDAKLEAAVRGSLRVAEELRLESIALPAISTGIFGFPTQRAAGVILRAIRSHFAGYRSRLRLVRVVLLDQETMAAFMTAWNSLE